MKKLIFIALLSILMTGLFAATPRVYSQMLVTDQGEQLPGVENTSSSHHPDYQVWSYITTRPGEVISTETHAYAQIKIYRFGNGTTVPYCTLFTVTMAPFPTQWVAGEILRTHVTHIPTGETMFWDCEIPTGTAAWGHRQPINPFPDGIVAPPATAVTEYSLEVTSNYTGAAIYLDAVDTGEVTPFTFDPAVAGTYTVVLEGVTSWNPVNYVYAADADATVHFVGTKIPEASLNPIPGDGTTLTWAWDQVDQPVNLGWDAVLNVTGYKLYWNGAADPVMLDTNAWVTPPIGEGVYTWQVVPYITDPAKGSTRNLSPVKVKIGDRNAPAMPKGDAVECPVWTFTIELEDPNVYEILITSEPTAAHILMNGVDSGFITPNTFYMQQGMSATFAVTLEGYGYWVPESIYFEDFTQNYNAHFIGQAIVVFPPDEPTPVPDAPGVTLNPTGTTDEIIYNAAIDNTTPVVVSLPNYSNLEEPIVIGLNGTGNNVTLTFNVETAGTWYGVIYYAGSWHQGTPFPLIVPPAGTITFTGVDFTAKDDVIVVLAEDDDPTLPVELSSFAAVLTATDLVTLTWVSESETEMLGYKVYRNEANEYGSALLVSGMYQAYNTSTQQTYKHEDSEVEVGHTYYYWLESVDYNTSHIHGPVSVTVTDDTPEIPVYVAELSNAYPNPFRMGSQARIDVTVKNGESGNVTVYNILGQAVKTFKVNEGDNFLRWDGRDNKGAQCGSGIYFYKLSTPSLNQTKKLVIMK